MATKTKPSFLRLFTTGFMLGAVGLIGLQVAETGPQAIVSVAHAATR